ncbi:hypothetical protein LZ32DRAFT_547168, partial [Colletotrichum eremochloae]
MSANGGFELSASTPATAAALSNSLNNHGHGGSSSSSSNSNSNSSSSQTHSKSGHDKKRPSAAAAAAAQLPARRPRHQITRSITEFSPPLRMHRHRHSHHHHPTQHTLHLNAQSRRDRDKLLLLDERAPGPGPGGRSSLDMTRSEHVTPSRSPDSSRRTSALVGPMIGGGENLALMSPPPGRKRKVDKAAMLLVEKNRTASRVTGLKNSLVELSGFSTATTRRLDETYYSVLEKKSMLQGTIAAIQELAAASRQLTGEFEEQAEEMARDVAAQLDQFGQFGEQETRIGSLQSRIETGRARIQGLSGRVDAVRRRIEGWENADREWQEKTRKRLRTMWIVMSVVFAVLIMLFVGAHYLGGAGAEVGGVTGLKGLER